MANGDSEGAVAAATRIAAGDDGTTYGRAAIFLHWLTALLVITQFALAQLWSLFGRPAHHVMVVAHMSLGMILAVVIVVRIIWRWMPGHQVSSLEVGMVRLASKAVHYLLYALLACEAVLGFILRWSGNEAMSFFGLLIPPPFTSVSKAGHHQVQNLHEWIGWLIVILAAGHAFAALYHHYVMKDRVLTRMFPLARPRAG
jgi:cytochrome b561